METGGKAVAFKLRSNLASGIRQDFYLFLSLSVRFNASVRWRELKRDSARPDAVCALPVAISPLCAPHQFSQYALTVCLFLCRT